MRRLVFLVLLAALLTSCGAAPVADVPTPVPLPVPTEVPQCKEQASLFITQVEPIVREWTDAVTLANNTPRASLSGQISTLQDVQRRTEALQAPDCAASVKQSLVGEMDATKRAFLAFLGQDTSGKTDDLFAMAGEQKAIFTAHLQILKAGQPIPETPPMFVDGLKISRDTLMKAHSDVGFNFPQNPGPGQATITASSRDNMNTVELVGPADNVSSATIIGSMNGFTQKRSNAIGQMLRTQLKTVMPDWTEGDAWLTAAFQQHGTEALVAANRGRVVRYQQINAGSDTSFVLVIYVPQG